MEANKYFLLGITIASVYSRAVRGELPPKILDSPPKVVSNLCKTSLIEFIFTKSTLRFIVKTKNSSSITKFSTRDCGDDLFSMILAGLGELSIVYFSVVTPYIPDSPPKDKSYRLHTDYSCNNDEVRSCWYNS